MKFDLFLRIDERKFSVITETDLGWLAGIIDGEGYLFLDCCDGGYYPRIKISNTSLLLFEKLTSIGIDATRLIVDDYDRKSVNRKTSYVLTLSSNDLRILLPKIMHCLVIKHQQARILWKVLKLIDHGVNTKNSEEILALYHQIRKLNKRGVSKRS